MRNCDDCGHKSEDMYGDTELYLFNDKYLCKGCLLKNWVESLEKSEILEYLEECEFEDTLADDFEKYEE